jgi:hypothetical protein
MSKVAYILAKLATYRARMQQAIGVARVCGDIEYVRDKRPDLEACDRRIESLKRVVRPEVLQEAHEITNAPI